MNKIELGKRIKKLREAANLTKFELGALVCDPDARPIANNTVDSWETGFTVPSIQRLFKIATVFEVSLDWLVGYDLKAAKMDEVNDLTTYHFLEYCEELGYSVNDNRNSISVFIPAKDDSVKYLIAWISKVEPYNYKLTTLIHPKKELLNDALYAYSKTTKSNRGDMIKRNDIVTRGSYYNIT